MCVDDDVTDWLIHYRMSRSKCHYVKYMHASFEQTNMIVKYLVFVCLILQSKSVLVGLFQF